MTHILSDSTFWDARVSGYYFSGKGVPHSGYTMPYHYDLATGIASGGSYLFWSGKESRTVAQGKLSHYATDFLGADHDFKFGAQFVGAGDQELWGFPGGAVYYDYYGGSYLAYFRQPYTYGGQSRSLGAYVEDVVSVSERLTLNLGVRYDHSRAVSQDIPRFNEVGEETGGVIEGLGTLYTSVNVLRAMETKAMLVKPPCETGHASLARWSRATAGAIDRGPTIG